jgi:aminodeoxyfutalosine deaminase
LQPETAVALASRHDLVDTLPTTDPTQLGKWFEFTDFAHFVEVILAVQNLIRTADDFALVAYQAGAAMAEQNIRYRELTVSPYNHTDVLDKGLTIDAILRGLEEGRQSAKRDFGVEMRWVFDIARNFCFVGPSRDYDPHPAETTLRFALDGLDHGVIALGLGGDESGCPPEPFRHAFEVARREGLKSVPHAGESLGAFGAPHVWGSINDLQADRIGHGVGAINDPGLLTLLLDRQIPLEVCPTSNTKTRVCDRVEQHPLPHLDRMGLMVTVNTDDPPIFGTTLNDEYRLLVDVFDYDRDGIVRLARNAFLAALCGAELRTSLLDGFDAWASS